MRKKDGRKRTKNIAKEKKKKIASSRVKSLQPAVESRRADIASLLEKKKRVNENKASKILNKMINKIQFLLYYI